MEHLFLALLVIIMIGALASGFPVAFALPGSAIISIGLARPIEIIAEPGKAKATGKPEANAPIIIITSKARNRCSII